MTFKLDTGDEVTTITGLTYKTLGNVTLQQPVIWSTYKVLGQFDGTFQISQVFGLKSNLLGVPTIKSLQLLKQVYSVSSMAQSVRRKFPEVFYGL